MKATGIPQKLIRLTEMTNTKAVVKINNQKTKIFEFKSGVKQGDGLSTTLFTAALHKAIRKIDQTGAIFNKLSEVCACADVVLIARTKQKLIQM